MKLHLFTFLSILFLGTAFAGMEKFSDDDVLSQVSSKLTVIESHLKNQRVYLSSAVFNWSELDQFQKDLMFAVAHDPHAQPGPDVPEELRPSYLSLKLKESWSKLEESVLEIEYLVKTEEWLALKADMETFFKLRDDFLYQPARVMIKSGELSKKFFALKEQGRKYHKNAHGKNQYHVRVMDPVIEGLAKEMHTLNQSVRQMKELRQPPPVVEKTIYKQENMFELIAYGVSALIAGVFFCYTWFAIRRSLRRKQKLPVDEFNEDSFDYRGWMKNFEAQLRSFKSTEDKFVEDQLILKQVGEELREARKRLNQADSQQDFYASLDQLNLTAPKIEDYFAKINMKKNTEVSRKMINTVVQLCDAIEAGQNIDTSSDQKKLRLVKNDPTSRAA